MSPTQEALADPRTQVSLEGVQRARKIVSRHLLRTPLIRHPVLVERVGLEVFIKHENHLPTGSFKVRGGVNYMANLPQERRACGVVTATRGNHGQAIAFAAATFGVPCVIVVPHGNNPDKNAAMRAYGAKLVEHGRDFDEAREHCEMLVEREGLTYVHTSNEPQIINGAGTYSLEVVEDLPDIDVMLVPIGGGSGVCGAITVFRALKPEVRIIGVQTEGAPAMYNSWKAGKITPLERAETFAEGLATRVPFELPFSIIREGIDEIVLVSDEEIRGAIRLLIPTTHNLAEGAGAAPLAAARKLRAQLEGKKIVCVLSGGNLDTRRLRWVLEADV
jgi:threonine dehydratase